MLFKGQEVSRQAALGLFWLIVAKDSAGPDEGWITETYRTRLRRPPTSERALAHKYLENWLKNAPRMSGICLRPRHTSRKSLLHARPSYWIAYPADAYLYPQCARMHPGEV